MNADPPVKEENDTIDLAATTINTTQVKETDQQHDEVDKIEKKDQQQSDQQQQQAHEQQQQQQQQQQHAAIQPPPPPLPAGWIMRECLPTSPHVGYFYYFHQDTGECTWEKPVDETLRQTVDLAEAALRDISKAESVAAAVSAISTSTDTNNGSHTLSKDEKNGANEKTNTVDKSGESNKRKTGVSAVPSLLRNSSAGGSSSKRPRNASDDQHTQEHSSSGGGGRKDQVRVLHLLKKHRGSRRPSSWRNSKIKITREDAVEEIRELASILKEVASDKTELRATFEELSKSESDCSSAKRGGDLGWFGRRKMQPAFEKASFALKVGELSDVVETSSGVHIILRMG